MVTGVEIFRKHFKDHTDKFILIGGTACDIAMSEMGIDFRATKDLDIVLIIEALDEEFSDCFCDFIRNGNYKISQNSKGKKKFYRFAKPQNENYPFMLELFSREPDVLEIPDNCHLTPIPISDECSSLSAILLDDNYYKFITSDVKLSEGLPYINAEHLIPLKTKAYLDLTEIKENGVSIDSKDIKKHKNDVFRLFQILSPESSMQLPESIANDLREFLELMIENPPDIKSFGIKTSSAEEIISTIKDIYSL